MEKTAAKKPLSLTRLVAVLQPKIVGQAGGEQNFASFLRVTCLHYPRYQELHAQPVAGRPAQANVTWAVGVAFG